MALPAGAIRRAQIPAMSPGQTGFVWGPRFYSVARGSGARVRLAVVDVAADTQASATIRVPALLKGDVVCAVAADSRWLVLMTVRDLARGGRAGDCSGYAGDPIGWRLLAVRLDASGVPASSASAVSSGLSQHAVLPTGEGMATTGLPSVALDGDRVAWTADAAPTASLPWRSDVLMRSLPGGPVARRAVTDGQPYHLALSGGTLAWSERLDRGDRVSVSVRVLPADAARPVQVWRRASASSGEAPGVALGGAGVAWDDPSAGVAWFSSLAPGAAPATLPPAHAAGDGWCTVGDVVGPEVVEGCQFGWTGDDDVNHFWQATVVWSAASGARVVVGDPALDPGEDLGASPAYGDGWVVALDRSATTDSSSAVVAAPLFSLGR